MPRFLCGVIVVVLLAGFESDCRKRHVRIPAPAAPQPAGTAAPQPQPAATAPAPGQPPPESGVPTTHPEIPQPPATQPATPQPSTPPPTEEPKKPSPLQPPTPPAQTPRRTTRPNPNPAPAPRLGDVLTRDQERQYNASIDQSLARAQSSLAAIANHRLTKDQQAVVTQVQSFIQQAQTSRKSNLPAARSLAERADVLARDLLGSLR